VFGGFGVCCWVWFALVGFDFPQASFCTFEVSELFVMRKSLLFSALDPLGIWEQCITSVIRASSFTVSESAAVLLGLAFIEVAGVFVGSLVLIVDFWASAFLAAAFVMPSVSEKLF